MNCDPRWGATMGEKHAHFQKALIYTSQSFNVEEILHDYTIRNEKQRSAGVYI